MTIADRGARAAALAACLAAPLALAPMAGHAQDTIVEINDFEHADIDGSGCVDWGELRNVGSEVFHAADLNGDGLITSDEMHAVTDPEGKEVETPTLDPAAYQEALREAFETADKDANGCLDEAEF